MFQMVATNLLKTFLTIPFSTFKECRTKSNQYQYCLIHYLDQNNVYFEAREPGKYIYQIYIDINQIDWMGKDESENHHIYISIKMQINA